MARPSFATTKSGPKFSPVSLEKQLESSVAFEQEKWLQINCIASSALPSDYALYITDAELRKVSTRA